MNGRVCGGTYVSFSWPTTKSIRCAIASYLSSFISGGILTNDKSSSRSSAASVKVDCEVTSESGLFLVEATRANVVHKVQRTRSGFPWGGSMNAQDRPQVTQASAVHQAPKLMWRPLPYVYRYRMVCNVAILQPSQKKSVGIWVRVLARGKLGEYLFPLSSVPLHVFVNHTF